MKRQGMAAVALWVALLVACVIVIGRASFTADLSAFLPREPTAEQQVLVDQLTEGAVSRLILIGIEAPDSATRARLSRELARRLRAAPEFTLVNNGESVGTDRDREFLLTHRYLLSPAVTADRFSEAGLRAAIGESIDLLASPAGLMLKSLLPRDPTGELIALLNLQQSDTRPAVADGVWASRDGTRALLLAQTRASGSDTDGQQRALATIRAAFDEATAADRAAARPSRLLLSGPGAFSVSSRKTIRDDVARLSAVGVLGIVGLLFVVYRSLTALGLGLLPVISGALAGVAAVSLGFGVVHGITLGFGTTLIGEAVDYSIYLFVQSTHEAAAGDHAQWVARFWPTIRLGMLTSVVGFATLLFSGFPGLAQLGLYSIAGIVVAAGVTRFVLPTLLPSRFRVRDVSFLGHALAAVMARGRTLRWVFVGLLVATTAVIGSHWHTLWNPELSALSPVSAADLALDRTLRADLGAPDVRYLVVVSDTDRERVLRAAERVGERLGRLVDAGSLGGFDTPVRFLPSVESQKARQQALPPPAELAARLQEATGELPLRPERLRPFLADVEAARNARPLNRADLDGTSFALATDALLVHRGGRWSALLPLKMAQRGTAGPAIDPEAIRAALTEAGQKSALLVDVKGETDRLYASYLADAIYLSLAGFAVMLGLLGLALRSPARVLRVVVPLVAAVVVVIAVHVLAGSQLNILHLVGMLLIVAVGSNYALFFDQRADGNGMDRVATLASLVLASATTVIGFGVLAFSKVPVLQAIGATVGPGAVLALLFSAVLAEDRAERPREAMA
ncbi:MAG: MMPL family transporter [Pseudomonadota bacterium]|nr:MMPL family transporter [Pseudomonadota bacterium]